MRTNFVLTIVAALSFGLAAMSGAAAQNNINLKNPKAAGGKQAVAPKVNRAAAARAGGGVRGARGGGGYPGGYGGGGYGGGFGGVVPGIILGLPAMIPPPGAVPPDAVIDDADYGDDPRPARRPPPPQRSSAQRGGGGVPPANERRLVPDEVVIEVPSTTSPQAITALERRHRLARLESQTLQLSGTTLFRWRIPDRRSVASVVRALEADGAVRSAQPNYVFALQQDAKAATLPDGVVSVAASQPAQESLGDKLQYLIGKLHLTEAHSIAKGDNVTVAVIDSGIDGEHPELTGTIVDRFDALDKPFTPHAHGTSIAALIAGHAKLMGAAPDAHILAVRAFDPAGDSAQATTFNILKGLDWAAAKGARVINMSFAGPADPAIHRSLEAARKKGIVLIAAAGNEGPKSPPLYPAADPNVIAVTATDAQDNLYAGANRGRHVAVAAPGVDIVVATPDGGYQVSTGTSYSAAEVSGIVALMLEHKPDLTPDAVRAALLATAKDLGPKGRDDQFGAGLADAYRAVNEEAPQPRLSEAAPRR